MLAGSRNFACIINNVKTCCLVPYADMLNHHRIGQVEWYYDNKAQQFHIEATSDIKKGDEIFDFYGRKSSSRFWLNYGFMVKNNEDMDEL